MTSCLPIEELQRRFSIQDVGHSAGVFDEEKLAWANRHYLRLTPVERLARLSVPYFQRAGIGIEPTETALAYLGSLMPMASGSVDRLDQIPCE